METVERYRGALLGLAAGDALGAALEFQAPGSFEPISQMAGGGPFQLEPGQWTDDTSMALCLAESLVERRGFDPADQLERYQRWFRDGYMSSTGYCFDIGNTVRGALLEFERTKNPFCGSTEQHTAGNGSIMRLAPVPLFYGRSPAKGIEMSGESSRTTHGAAAAIDACRYLGALILGALQDRPKAELLSERFTPVEGCWNERPLCAEIDEIARGSFKARNPPAIRGSGYVVKCLEAALWAFHGSDSFQEGCLRAVNLGDDADTTGAVFGQLAGAFYGQGGIPDEWLRQLAKRDLITTLAEKLYAAAQECGHAAY